MPIHKEQGRQWVLSAEKTVLYTDDFGAAADNAVVQNLFRLPVGARVVGGEVVVEVAWDNGTTGSVDIGDVTDPNRYTATPVDLTATGRTALTLTGFKTTEAERDVDVDPNFVGTDATQGQAYIRIEYVIEGKANETQPLDVDEYGAARVA